MDTRVWFIISFICIFVIFGIGQSVSDYLKSNIEIARYTAYTACVEHNNENCDQLLRKIND